MRKERILSFILLGLLLGSMSILQVQIAETQSEEGRLWISVVDSATGEEINGINVKASWGPAFEEEQVSTTQSGRVSFKTAWDYTGDALIAIWDDCGRYQSMNKIVHVSFTPWVNVTAEVEIKLDRLIPLQVTSPGNYIVSLMQDREIVYYGEEAFIIVEIERPYPNVALQCRYTPSDLGCLIYGTGYLLSGQNKTTIRIRNNDYGHFEKTGVFNLSLVETFWGETLETAQFTLTFKPSWGYELYELKVNTIDAKTKEIVSPVIIRVWWGSTFNEYESGWSSGQTFDLGFYPNGSVRIRVEHYEGDYFAQFKEVTVTEKTTTVTLELQRVEQPIDGTPTYEQLWIVLFVIAIGIIVAIGLVVKRRKPTS